ncbi:MAG: glycine dehydrogenase subunit 1 [Limisphaerales bacterium]|jgi:glycine dehydrogenase subunit 1
MPFVPHTVADEQAMLEEIGVAQLQDLFDEIPSHLASGQLQQVPEGISEMAMLQKLRARAEQDNGYVCFLGGGSYDHHIPSAVWDLTTRGEFMTAYTPYQAEASQGTLQLIYEYQSMMARLTAMDISNASVYDGASGLAEAVLMALRANKKNKSKSVWIAESVHPHYVQATRNIVTNQGVRIVPLALNDQGIVDLQALGSVESEVPAAVVVQQPNFFGSIEAVDALTDWAHELGILVIAVVNPMTLAVLKPPGEWGETGADIVCGDGQPLGVPMASGGPSFGFMCCRENFVRQMPGRIIGRTVDLDGKPGYTLTLQAREQHIRRGKATSNICTNQGLLVTAGTIYMSIVGPQGLREVAAQSYLSAKALRERLCAVPGVERFFDHPCFHEFSLKLAVPANAVLERMQARGILAGLALQDFSQLDGADHGILVATTEKRTADELDRYVDAFGEVMAALTEEGA